MWKLRIFGAFLEEGSASTSDPIIEDGMRRLETENNLQGLTHSPATHTIYYNGNPIGCYYWS